MVNSGPMRRRVPHGDLKHLIRGNPAVQQTSDPHMGTGVGRGRAEQARSCKSKAKVARKGSWEPLPRVSFGLFPCLFHKS